VEQFSTYGPALILDMDGVIIDSNPLHREAWRVYNRRFGLETTEEMFSRMYGKRNDEIIRDFYGRGLPEKEVENRGAEKEHLYRELMAGRIEEFLVPGLREFLSRHAEAPLGVGTNAEPANVDFVLDSAGIRRYFRVVVDGHQVTHPKPHPEVYLTVAALLERQPADCIVFEDSHSGVQAALAAGMRVVGVKTTNRELPGTSLEIDDFRDEELERWLGQQRAVA
jgi:beta-phosphoglucomutase family hydrolase